MVLTVWIVAGVAVAVCIILGFFELLYPEQIVALSINAIFWAAMYHLYETGVFEKLFS